MGKKVEEILKIMRDERGYPIPELEFIYKADPDYLEAYNNLYGRSLRDGKVLPAKTRELITIAILAYRGSESGCIRHAKRALRLGATKEEILEAIETTMIPGGAPTLVCGLRALMQLEKKTTSSAPKKARLAT